LFRFAASIQIVSVLADKPSHAPSWALSSLPPFPSFGHRDHDVQFYHDDDFLVDGIEKLLRGAVEKGDGAVCVATKKHLTALAGRFRIRDQGMTAATEQGRYLPLDVADVLSAVMSDGKVDEAGISEILGGVNKYPPAEPEVLRLLAPQRGLIATGQSQKQDLVS